MKHTTRRVAVILSTVVAVLFLASQAGVHGASERGTYLTANGYRTPIYGASLIHNANGDVGTSCDRLSTTEIEAQRFGRRVSRAMAVNSPHAVLGSTTGGATFEITYSDPSGQGFNDPANAPARAGLEAAVLSWTKVIQGTVAIKVDASMPVLDNQDSDSGSTLLASAGPVDFWLKDDKAIPSALMWQLLKRRQLNAGDDADIEVHVNPDVNWDYNVTGAAPRGKVSFVYTLIHEIGHGLGFIDSFDIETGKVLNDPTPFPYDVFVNRRSDSIHKVIDRGGDQAIDDMQSNDLFFSGDNAREASARSIRPLPMIKLYAPNPYEPGSSISHVDQDTYADFKTGLMTPRDFGSGTDKIDILTLAIMKDIGYQLIANATTARVKN